MSFGKAFGPVTCPMLFYSLPHSLGRPVQYSALLDLVFLPSEGCEGRRASISLSSQAWQVYVFQEGLRPSSSSSPCLVLWEGWPSTLLFLTLSSFLLSTVIAIGLISTCPCKGGRLMFLGRPQASLLLIVLRLKAVHVIGLVPICPCKGGRFMSFRKAFGLVLLSSSPCLLSVTAVYVMGLENIYMSLQVW